MADETVRTRFEAETSGFTRAVDGAAKATERLADSADKAGRSTKDMGDKGAQSAQRLEAAQKRATTAQDRAADAAGRLRVANERLNQARESKNVGRIVSAEEAVARAQRDVERTAQEAAAAQDALQRGLAESGAEAQQSVGKFERLSAAVKDQRSNMETAGTGLLTIGTALTATSAGVGKAAMDWESAFAGVQKTIDDTTEGYAELSDELRALATTLPTTHTEVAAVAEAAGQLGVAREDVVGFTRTMIDLGETTNLTADEAATNIAQISNVMGTMAREGAPGVERFGAALVALGNDGASTEAEILNMAQRIAGAGATLGATEADVLALSNTLASMGVRAELGGGVATRVLLKMRTAVDEGGESLSTFADVAGVSADEFSEKFRTAPVEALGMVAQGIHGVNEAGGNVTATLTDMGIKGTEETQVMLALANSGDLLTESLELSAKAWAENSALAEEAEKRYATAESRISVSWNKIKDSAIDAGGAILPMVASLAEGIGTAAEWFGALPAPVQGALGAMTGIVGVTTLAAGGLLKLAPAAMDTWKAFDGLAEKAPRAAGTVGKFGKVAGAAATGAVAVTAVTTALTSLYNSTRDAAPGVEEVANALLHLQNSGDSASLDSKFDFSGITTHVNGFGDALKRIDLDNPIKHIQSFGDTVYQQDNVMSQVRDTITSMDQALSVMDASQAAEQMNALRLEAESVGRMDLSSWSELQKVFPEYAASVEAAANATGNATSEADLFQAAMGNLPPHMRDVGDAGSEAAAGAEAAGEGIEGMGESAEEAADALQELLDGLRATGRIPMDAAAAARDYEAALDAMAESIKDNGKTLDRSTDAGRQNEEALHAIAQAATENAAAAAEAGAGQEDLQRILQNGASDFFDYAVALTGSREKADQLTRSVYDIPDNVSIQTWMADEALRIAEGTGAAVVGIPDGVQVIADMDETAMEKAFKTAEAVKTIPGYKKVDVAVSDEGTPGQIQSRIDGITGKTEYVFVDDNGTSHNVQRQIINIDGKDVPVYVGDNGTVYATQGNISSIHGHTVVIPAEAQTATAEGELNHTARDRHTRIIASMVPGQNYVPNVSLTAPRKATGGIAGGGNLPRYAMGRLPYTGLGTDRILGVNAFGVPVAMVDDGEGIIRESSTRKHPHLLGMVNDDDPRVSVVGRLLGLPGYAAGNVGRQWSAQSVNVGLDYDRLAAAVGERGGPQINLGGVHTQDPVLAARVAIGDIEHQFAAGGW